MSATTRQGFRIARGEDRFGEHRGLGIGTLTFKVSTADSGGALLVCEIAPHAEGGPARHLHHNQDEWFPVVVGGDRIRVGRGLSPRTRRGSPPSTPGGPPPPWPLVGR